MKVKKTISRFRIEILRGRNKMSKYLALPTWLIVIIITPFLPIDHQWNGRRFTLNNWYTGRTSYTRIIDFCLWINGSLILVLLGSLSF